MKEITLKEWSAYLPYGLKFKQKRDYNSEQEWLLIGLTMAKEPEFPTLLSMRKDYKNIINIWSKNAKPVLRDLSDLTKEIEHNGEKFVPAIVLAEMTMSDNDKLRFKNFEYDVRIVNKPFGKLLKVTKCDQWFLMVSFSDPGRLKHFQYEKLLEWHFNVFQIPDELILKVTEDFNPYK